MGKVVRKGRGSLQNDFEDAYDHVDWGFLDHVLERKGFSKTCRS